MKLIPDSNSQNKYTKGLQYIVNTSVAVVIASIAVTGVLFAYGAIHDWSFFTSDVLPPAEEICYDDVVVSRYAANRADLNVVRGYTKNYRDLNNLDTAGIVITNEMLKAMSEEHNLLSGVFNITGFHLYFADKSPNGGSPSIVFVPIGLDFKEFYPKEFKVLEVPQRVCAPCPLLCDDYELTQIGP